MNAVAEVRCFAPISNWYDHGHLIEIRNGDGPGRVELAMNMRWADRIELSRYSGMPPGAALREALARSAVSRCCLIDGEVAGMWGVVGSMLTGTGWGWCLTARIVDRYPGIFLRTSRLAFAEMRLLFPRIICDVDAEYWSAARWLGMLGFRVVDRVPVNGHAFIRMAI